MFGNRNTSEPATVSTVPPMHYEHCTADLALWLGTDLGRAGRTVVDAAKEQGVSVWKVLPAADLPYRDKRELADRWASNGRGPAVDREEFFA
ncbi:MAG TPA: hypothetical protein VI172_14850 [Candidatus Dormibacteraeota bacterium]|jgi:hypothetical protein